MIGYKVTMWVELEKETYVIENVSNRIDAKLEAVKKTDATREDITFENIRKFGEQRVSGIRTVPELPWKEEA